MNLTVLICRRRRRHVLSLVTGRTIRIFLTLAQTNPFTSSFLQLSKMSDDELLPSPPSSPEPKAIPKKRRLCDLDGNPIKVKKVKVTKNLFVDFDSEIKGPDEKVGSGETAKKSRVPVMKQADAVQHVTAQMSTTVFELIRDELPELRSAGKDLMVSSMEDDVDLVPCVLWKIDAEFCNMIQKASEKEGTGVVPIRPKSTLNHVLILVQAPLLHKGVRRYLKSAAANSDVAVQSGGDGGHETSNEPDDDESDLVGIVRKCVQKYSTYSVTLVIYGRKAYLKSQRSQMKALLAEENSELGVPKRSK